MRQIRGRALSHHIIVPTHTEVMEKIVQALKHRAWRRSGTRRREGGAGGRRLALIKKRPRPQQGDGASEGATNSSTGVEQEPVGLLEQVLCEDCVEDLLSYLDTKALITLSMVSRGLNAQALGHLRVIESSSVLYSLDHYGPPSCLGRLSRLVAWDQSGHSAVPLLMRELPKYPNLERLNLEYRSLRCEDARNLDEVIKGGACRNLRSLDVASNFLRKEGGLAIASCLCSLTHLEELVLSDNSIYFEATSAICNSLMQGACPSLKVIRIAYNWIGVCGSRAIGAALGSGSLQQLEVLDLRGNGITSVGLCFLIEALMEEAHRPPPTSSTTTSSILTDDDYDDEEEEDDDGMDNRILTKNNNKKQDQSQQRRGAPCSNLRELLLGYNYIGTEGSLALAEALTLGYFPHLQYLSLAHNSVDAYSTGLLRDACGDHCLLEV